MAWTVRVPVASPPCRTSRDRAGVRLTGVLASGAVNVRSGRIGRARPCSRRPRSCPKAGSRRRTPGRAASRSCRPPRPRARWACPGSSCRCSGRPAVGETGARQAGPAARRRGWRRGGEAFSGSPRTTSQSFATRSKCRRRRCRDPSPAENVDVAASLQAVGTGAAGEDVLSGKAVELVVAGLPEERVGLGRPAQHVVSRPGDRAGHACADDSEREGGEGQEDARTRPLGLIRPASAFPIPRSTHRADVATRGRSAPSERRLECKYEGGASFHDFAVRRDSTGYSASARTTPDFQFPQDENPQLACRAGARRHGTISMSR